MTEHAPRLFAHDAGIRRIGEGLVDRSLARDEWTHEAHIAATAWMIAERPDMVPERDLPILIAAYNVAVGGVNDDHNGYHETITQAYVAGIRTFIAAHPRLTLAVLVNALLAAPEGRRDWPLRFYSRELLFSVPARRGFVAPDLAPLPAVE